MVHNDINRIIKDTVTTYITLSGYGAFDHFHIHAKLVYLVEVCPNVWLRQRYTCPISVQRSSPAKNIICAVDFMMALLHTKIKLK